MPHSKILRWPSWLEKIAEQDPCLGRILQEAVVAHDAAVEAGADTAAVTKDCRKAFESAKTTLETIRSGALVPNTDAAWKRASDALRKFTQALDCTGQGSFSGVRKRRRR